LPKPEIYLEPKARAAKVIELLEKQYANAKIALNYTNPLQLLIATILSAQATDEQINKITPALFKKYRTAEDFANASIGDLEEQIKSSGFYHNKAKNIQNCCKMLVEKYGGKVPRTMTELLELPGVARKTANIVLQNAYGAIEGIMRLVPKDEWMRITDLLIWHGRQVCTAKKPNCAGCVLNKICPCAFAFG
jgi:endonuclease-3